jgi:hypothetical protein
MAQYFLVHILDECGHEASVDVYSCSTHDEVRDYMDDNHPEVKVQAIYSQEEWAKKYDSNYDQAAEDYDNEYYYG